MRKRFTLPTSACTLLALGVFNHAFTSEKTVDLPASTFSATDTEEDIPDGYQGKPSATTSRLKLTAQPTPQGITSIKRTHNTHSKT